jgi:hypothetical protein
MLLPLSQASRGRTLRKRALISNAENRAPKRFGP